ncbi:hypothetical protein [Stomatohabitans albus]|uniref:hypothetical protein n=1 Tax=Stomatohabitans albus TaxID=3110766 RepID=UPI00300D3CB4
MGKFWIAGATVLTVLLTACAQTPAPSTSTTPEPTDAGNEAEIVPIADGPHAPEDRSFAPRTVSTSPGGKAMISEVDLGNAQTGEYRAPIRGVLVVPTEQASPAPLIVVSHLRVPNCANEQFAYPCPEGVEELRFDRGMTYLGEHLAAQGYAALIPDVSGAFIGDRLNDPYDQRALWTQTVSTLVNALRSDISGTTATYGLDDAIRHVDLDHVGLFVHSRSGMMVDTAIQTLGADHVKSVLAYGPSYDTFDPNEFSPAGPDIPYLALAGEADLDVGASANLWLAEHIGTERTTPALAASLPGFGHLLVNRALSSTGQDERTACDVVACPDARAHEQLLTTVAAAWFNTTVKGQADSLGVTSNAPLPDTLAGQPVTWLAHTIGTQVTHIGPSDLQALKPGTAAVCRHSDPMSPVPAENPCPEPEQGVMEVVNEVSHLKAAKANVDVAGATMLAVHLAPVGAPDAKSPGTPITIGVTLADGKTWDQSIAPSDSVLKNRATTDDNGTYRLGTIRIALPDSVTAGEIKTVTIEANEGAVEVRGIDVVASS